MANLNTTKKQITKALKQLASVDSLEGRVSLTYDLPEGNVLENIEKFEKMLESITIDGLNRDRHIFYKRGLEIYVCSK